MTKKELKEKLLREVTMRKQKLTLKKEAVQRQYDSDLIRVTDELAELKVEEDAFKSIKV